MYNDSDLGLDDPLLQNHLEECESTCLIDNDCDSDDELISEHKRLCVSEALSVLSNYDGMDPEMLKICLRNSEISKRTKRPEWFDRCGTMKQFTLEIGEYEDADCDPDQMLFRESGVLQVAQLDC